ncbi:Oligoribonuclease [Candidatus Arsenophonus lipoptenae]|uniref:Oligoribonuclease n=1 Tax=Candidatus Arsenophonus lipoptenae TaxID=634113 RepID=A0A0X9W795_9GAMM|nr:oligoribonuclease [Candidatus Arsenophonus lipoptenae]AMA65152.1 Oligoribonuclease [Candidatus Arsenophonus lipoptenae]
MTNNNYNLIWIDLEMTGLDPDQNRIIEIATIVTDSNLEILSEGPVIAIHQSEKQILLMDEWNMITHNKSGLIDRVKCSQYNENKAELETIVFLEKWVPKGVSPICGNSVAQDRRFLFKYMPKLEKYFHYHYLDVSSLRELVLRWKPEILNGFMKKNTHQALEDIYESISEISYYRKYFIKL